MTKHNIDYIESLRILGRKRIVWINPTGNGNKTAAHLREKN
jgi:hypothetical protein